MEEEGTQATKTVAGPRKLLDNALRAVKGENTMQVVEDFTAEMTLVAEGLCEDHGRLRKAVEDIEAEQDRLRQRTASEQEAMENALRADRAEVDEKLAALARRVDALEKREKQLLSEKEHDKGRKARLNQGLMRSLIILAGIVCGSWVIVSVLNFLKP